MILLDYNFINQILINILVPKSNCIVVSRLMQAFVFFQSKKNSGLGGNNVDLLTELVLKSMS